MSCQYQRRVISGSPSSVNDPNLTAYNSQLFDSNISILGICYELHMLNRQRGWYNSTRIDIRKDGQYEVQLDVTECKTF